MVRVSPKAEFLSKGLRDSACEGFAKTKPPYRFTSLRFRISYSVRVLHCTCNDQSRAWSHSVFISCHVHDLVSEACVRLPFALQSRHVVHRSQPNVISTWTKQACNGWYENQLWFRWLIKTSFLENIFIYFGKIRLSNYFFPYKILGTWPKQKLNDLHSCKTIT